MLIFKLDLPEGLTVATSLKSSWKQSPKAFLCRRIYGLPGFDFFTMHGATVLADAVHRVRTGQVIRKPGFDGEFDVIKVFPEGEISGFAGQLNLFVLTSQKPRVRKVKNLV